MIDALGKQEQIMNSIAHPFGEHQEEAIISLILDHPEFFSGISRFLSHNLFRGVHTQYIMAHMMTYYEKYSIFPTRGMLADLIEKSLTVDDADYDDIIAIVNHKSDPRDTPAIKDQLLQWARSRSYGLLYDPDTMQKYYNGDFDALEEIINKARNIQDIGTGCMWFFKELDRCFMQESFDHFTTGFAQLDRYMHKHGPVRKEMLIFVAPTARGKSIMLCNNAIANVLNKRNVLYITFELSDLLSAIRMVGAMTNKPIDDRRFKAKDEIMAVINHLQESGDVGELVIQEFAPDEVSVDGIYALVDHLKRSAGFTPDIIIVDYLELMVSRRAADNDNEYSKQKAIATQIRGLAKNTNTLVFTASQTNRSGNDVDTIDLTKIAECYGKTMPADYIISINQTPEEAAARFGPNPAPGAPAAYPAPARLFIAKNRNGDQFVSVPVTINYTTMAIREVL